MKTRKRSLLELKALEKRKFIYNELKNDKVVKSIERGIRLVVRWWKQPHTQPRKYHTKKRSDHRRGVDIMRIALRARSEHISCDSVENSTHPLRTASNTRGIHSQLLPRLVSVKATERQKRKRMRERERERRENPSTSAITSKIGAMGCAPHSRRAGHFGGETKKATADACRTPNCARAPPWL